MRKTDISKYTDKIDVQPKNPSTFLALLSAVGRVLVTLLMIAVIAGVIVGVSVGLYIFGLSNEPTGIDLNARSMNQTSFIYTKNPETDQFEEYQRLYGTENRVWVSLNKMPKYMPQAVVAIEDKRFYDHHGVDWKRTGSAVVSLLTGSDNYGGSTITQQLIKNITYDNEVSLNRKLKEIFRALNIEKEYSKDDIIEAYLNVVNFGNNCQGVEAAAQLYFDKPISECSVCECAAIAGITQNPTYFNPLVYPENNKERRELVLSEMYDQEMLTKAEYDAAMKESETLTFIGWKKPDADEDDEDEETINVQNWYIDQMFYDLRRDLAKYYDISEDAASEKLYTEGLKIYCAMDTEMQEKMYEQALKSNVYYDYYSGEYAQDYDLQFGMTMVAYDGRVIATVGSSKEKTVNLEWDRASHSVLQPGSSIKAVIPYPMALEMGIYNYSSLVKDEKYDKWKLKPDGTWEAGPDNAYTGHNHYMTLPEAIAWSSNAGAVQTINLVGTRDAYNQAVSNLGFRHLANADADNMGALSIGGMEGGVTVREMAAAIQYVGNSGLYFEPYTYYYVTDTKGNILLDNRNNAPIEAYSPETAYLMNRLLRYNVLTSQHSASQEAQINGWDIVGKTGTTDYNHDIWFVGTSPYCAMACWMGYDQPSSIPGEYSDLAAKNWKTVMAMYLEGKTNPGVDSGYDKPTNITKASYCTGSGLLPGPSCTSTAEGYYVVGRLPAQCDGIHKVGVADGTPIELPTELPTEPDETEPTEPDETEPTEEPVDEPTDEPIDEPTDEPVGEPEEP